jgi:hypothetical protein
VARFEILEGILHFFIRYHRCLFLAFPHHPQVSVNTKRGLTHCRRSVVKSCLKLHSHRVKIWIQVNWAHLNGDNLHLHPKKKISSSQNVWSEIVSDPQGEMTSRRHFAETKTHETGNLTGRKRQNPNIT